jgi:hypothetical protein
VRSCIAPLIVLFVCSLAMACDYTIRDIGFVEFAPPKLRMVILFNSSLDERQVRVVQGELAAQALEPECRMWNLSFQSGSLANVIQPTAEQRGWVNNSELHWSCWLVRDDGASRLLAEASLEQPPRWSELLEQHLQPPLSKVYREQALASFAQLMLFESASDSSNDKAWRVMAESIEALDKAASLLPRPVVLPVRQMRVAVHERAEYAVLLWALHGEDVTTDEAAVCTLYGRGRLAGQMLHGTAINVEGLLSQLVLVGQSCECGTQRNWVNYPQLPLAWPEAVQNDMAHHLGFDPANSVVVEEVKRIIQRGPQNLPNGRDDVSDVVSSTLSLGGSTGAGVNATVLQGDGWGFDPPAGVSTPSGLIPKLLNVPPGRPGSQAAVQTADSIEVSQSHDAGANEPNAVLTWSAPAMLERGAVGQLALAVLAVLGILSALLVARRLYVRQA